MSTTSEASMMSAEELFKIWAFSASLRRVSLIAQDDIAWLSRYIKAHPQSQRNIASQQEQQQQEQTSLDTVIEFIQRAAVLVTGGNMEFLSQAALFAFGVMVELPEATRHMAALRAFEKDTVAGDAEPPRVPPKLLAKPKLLAALWARYYDQMPPPPRSRELPSDLKVDIALEVAADAKHSKRNRSERSAAPTRTASVPSPPPPPGPDSSDLHVQERPPVFVRAPNLSSSLKECRAPTPPELDSRDVNALASRVAALVHVLSVTTPKVLLERLQKESKGVTLQDVHGVLQRLQQRDVLVVEHGVVYPI